MNALPLVTIICTCFNHESFVTKAVTSVLNQSYKNIELIIVNNGCTDNSEIIIKDILSKNKNLKYLYLKETLPLTKAFNLAFKQANGDFLIDLSADDQLLPNCVEQQISFFLKQNNKTALIFGNAYHINEKNDRLKPYFEVDKNNNIIDSSLYKTNYIKLLSGGLCMCSASAMFTKKHFELLNGFNEDLFFEDLDYWLRLSRQFEIKFLDSFLVEKRFLDTSLGNQFYKNEVYSKKINESLYKIYIDALNYNSLIEENRALLKRLRFSTKKSYINKQWNYFLKFGLLELKCRLYLLK